METLSLHDVNDTLTSNSKCDETNSNPVTVLFPHQKEDTDTFDGNENNKDHDKVMRNVPSTDTGTSSSVDSAISKNTTRANENENENEPMNATSSSQTQQETPPSTLSQEKHNAYYYHPQQAESMQYSLYPPPPPPTLPYPILYPHTTYPFPQTSSSFVGYYPQSVVPQPVVVTPTTTLPTSPQLVVPQQPERLLQFYETRMKEHASAYASAAAGAALIASQLAYTIRGTHINHTNPEEPTNPNQNQNQNQNDETKKTVLSPSDVSSPPPQHHSYPQYNIHPHPQPQWQYSNVYPSYSPMIVTPTTPQTTMGTPYFIPTPNHYYPPLHYPSTTFASPPLTTFMPHNNHHLLMTHEPHHHHYHYHSSQQEEEEEENDDPDQEGSFFEEPMDAFKHEYYDSSSSLYPTPFSSHEDEQGPVHESLVEDNEKDKDGPKTSNIHRSNPSTMKQKLHPYPTVPTDSTCQSKKQKRTLPIPLTISQESGVLVTPPPAAVTAPTSTSSSSFVASFSSPCNDSSPASWEKYNKDRPKQQHPPPKVQTVSNHPLNPYHNKNTYHGNNNTRHPMKKKELGKSHPLSNTIPTHFSSSEFSHQKHRKCITHSTSLHQPSPILFSSTSHCSAGSTHGTSHPNTSKRIGGGSTVSTTPSHAYSTSSSHHYPKPFNPVGMTGIAALYDLCNKRRWNPPQFIRLNPSVATSTAPAAGSKSSSSIHVATDAGIKSIHVNEYIILVSVQNEEMGRGRGGTKKSAQQDAARKALLVFYPRMTFDTNGIILNLGEDIGGASMNHNTSNESDDESMKCSNATGLEQSTSTARTNASSNRNRSDSYTLGISSSQILEEHLAPKLASRLAINTTRIDPFSSSPSTAKSLTTHDAPMDITTKEQVHQNTQEITETEKHSEPMTIDTDGKNEVASSAVSEKCELSDNCPHQSKPSLSLLQQSSCYHVYPSASTTSGVSSASEEDEYYASRGASVCSALLHAMAQIDERILNPPSYSYDTCANLLAQLVSEPAKGLDDKDHLLFAGVQFSNSSNSSKRKGGLLSMACKRPFATNVFGRSVAVHRSSFSCTATLDIKVLPDRNGKFEFECPPIDSNNQTERFAPSENVDSTMDNIDETKSNNKNVVHNVSGERMTACERLQAIGTGATKREAKHVASAKLLSLLFPQCNGMVEVIAAAEAARERYAASKALTKQTKKAGLSANLSIQSSEQDAIVDVSSCDNSRTALSDHSAELSSLGGKDTCTKTPFCTEDSVNTANLKNEGALDTVSPETLLQQRELEDAADTVLLCCQEDLCDRRLAPNINEDDDVGRLILTRAKREDTNTIFKLLSNTESKKYSANKKSEYSPASEIALAYEHRDLSCFDVSSIAMKLWGQPSLVLILVRPYGSDEAPLGCAILTIKSELPGDNVFRLSEIAHEEHLPKERFIDCLKSFSLRMGYQLDTLANELSTRMHLQSVREENEDDITSDDDGIENSDLRKTSQKRSKRTRVI